MRVLFISSCFPYPRLLSLPHEITLVALTPHFIDPKAKALIARMKRWVPVRFRQRRGGDE